MFDWHLQDDMANASEDQDELLRKKVGKKWLIKCIISNREGFFFPLQLCNFRILYISKSKVATSEPAWWFAQW